MGKGTPRKADSDDARCEALTTMTEWKKRNAIEQQCPFVARVMLGGKKLCNRHAQVEALAVCIKSKMGVVLPERQVHIPYQAVLTVRKRAAHDD